MDILGTEICPYRNLKRNCEIHSTDINLTTKKYRINKKRFKNKMEKQRNKHNKNKICQK
jgi:hypothetical protein